jgi:amino acid adenylation domain-containing protein
MQIKQKTSLEQNSYPSYGVHELFEQMAELIPSSIALVFREQEYTYRELEQRSNQLAHLLIENGVVQSSLVAILQERGPDQIISMLAILKAGAAYLPLDINFPSSRLQQMLEDSESNLVLTHSNTLETYQNISTGGKALVLDTLHSTLQKQPVLSPGLPNSLDDSAYVMYTSGSTGRPKGVDIPHRGIVRLVYGVEPFPLNKETVFLHMAASSFDASTFKIWGTLLRGGRCVLFPTRVPSIATLRTVMKMHQINTLLLTTAYFNLIIDEAPEIFSSVRYLMAGGEALSPGHIQKALNLLPHTRLFNGYGPTENTTLSTIYEIKASTFKPGKALPIGKPIGFSQCYVLDYDLRPLPAGEIGELYVAGAGLARGYWNQPDLSAERFLPDPFSLDSNARMYRTGDLAFWNKEGNLEFIGRVDNQVKIRGFRIELGEIDIALEQSPEVKQAISKVYDDEVRGKWIATYVQLNNRQDYDAQKLKAFAQAALPEYMVPSIFTTVQEWPYTPNGKIDRTALPRPEQLDFKSCKVFVTPKTSTQSRLAVICKRLLKQAVSIDDNFFEIGGDSLMAVRLCVEIERNFGKELPLDLVLSHFSIRKLASILDSDDIGLSDNFESLRLIQEGTPETIPLFMIHGGGGGIFAFKEFASHLGKEQPVYAFQLAVWNGKRCTETLKDLAAEYVQELMLFQPNGKYRLGGHCIGAVIAMEMARQLNELGYSIDGPIIAIDSPNLSSTTYSPDEPEINESEFERWMLLKTRLSTMKIPHNNLPKLVKKKQKFLSKEYLKQFQWIRSFYTLISSAHSAVWLPIALKLNDNRIPIGCRARYSQSFMLKAASQYSPPVYSGDILYFRSESLLGHEMGTTGWWDDLYMGFSELCGGNFEAYVVGNDHNGIVSSPFIAQKVLEAFDVQNHLNIID